MIGYLRGKVLDHQEGRLLLGITASTAADAPVVGYQLSVPQSAEYGAWTEGKSAEFYIHTHVREDALDLYGFATKSEKELFLTLLSVNGVGPKGALGILTKVPAGQLVDCILRADKDALCKVPGVGKKTAERLVLELQDPLRKRMEAGQLGEISMPRASASRPAGASSKDTSDTKVSNEIAATRDARAALVSLGYREADVNTVLTKLVEDRGASARAEELIRSALQRLS